MLWFLYRKKGQLSDQSGPLHLFRSLVLVVHLLLSIIGTEISAAEEKPAEHSAPTAEPAPAPPPTSTVPVPADTALEPKGSKIEKLLDKTHGSIQQSILKQVVRFDDFFGNIQTENQRETKYEIRLRNAIQLDNRGNFQYSPKIRANIVLSKIDERLRLAISGEDEQKPLTPTLPDDPGNPGFDRTSGNFRLVNTELRYRLIPSPSQDLLLGAGVELANRPQVFARSRFQYTHNLSDISLFRFGETLFVKTPDGPGATTEIALERLLDQKTLLRWDSTGTVISGLRGVEWGSELSLIHTLSSLSAINVIGGAYGNTSFDGVINAYRLLARYRRNFLRSWLFYELEPELFWPRRADGSFPTNFIFTFRLEVVFKGIDVTGR